MWKLRLRGIKWQKGLAGDQGLAHPRSPWVTPGHPRRQSRRIPPRSRATDQRGPGRREAAPARQGFTFSHVAREPARHIATSQREALPPGGPRGVAQRARSQPHGAEPPGAAPRREPLPPRTAPPSPRPRPKVPALQGSANGPRVRTTQPRASDQVQGGGAWG